MFSAAQYVQRMASWVAKIWSTVPATIIAVIHILSTTYIGAINPGNNNNDTAKLY